MILGNSRFGPVGSWLVQDNGQGQEPPTVSPIFPPTWLDKRGIVGVSAVNGSLLAATTDGRLLRLSNVDTPEAIVDRLIDRACEISSPLVRDAGLSRIDGASAIERRRVHLGDHELGAEAMPGDA